MRALLLVALLFSCSSSTLKPTDYSAGDERQSAGCEAEAGKAAASTQPNYYSETFNQIFDACMRSKGFRKK